MASSSVEIREGQWLRGGENLFADCDGEECLVVLDSAVANHPLIDQIADAPGIHTAAEAVALASAAATRAKLRGSVDGFQRIAVFLRDLIDDT